MKKLYSILSLFFIVGCLNAQQFSERVIINDPSQPYYLDVADFDGDGDMDCITSEDQPSLPDGHRRLHYYENNGDNTYKNSVTIGSTYGLPRMTHADLDGDDDLDIIVGHNSGEADLYFIENLGDGSFEEPLLIPLPYSGNLSEMKFVDLDGDEDLDLIVTRDTQSVNVLIYFENLGDLQFEIAEDFSFIVAYPQTFEAHDFDNDGDVDVITGGSASCCNEIIISNNEGNLEFGFTELLYDNDVGLDMHVNQLEGEDIDGDDLRDIIFRGEDLDNNLGIYWMRNLGDLNFAFPELLKIDSSNFSMDLEVFDIDGDGDRDIISSRISPIKEIFYFENDGNAVFGEEITLDPGSSTNLMRIVDLDQDDDLDIVSFDESNFDITAYNNDGSGNIEHVERIVTNYEYLTYASEADLDSDEKTDFILSCYHTDRVSWLNYDPETDNYIEHPIDNLVETPLCAEPVDVDGDGDKDVLASSYNGDKILLYLNQGDGFFEEGITIDEMDSPTYIEVFDADNDADLDFVSGSYTSNEVKLCTNDGSGVFSTTVLTTELLGPRKFKSRDIDGDDDLDLLIASSSDNSISWMSNEGAGVFASPQLINNEMELARDAEAGDFDGDGDLDVVSVSFYDGKLAWYENLGSGIFGPQQILSEEISSGREVRVNDMDLDGNIDILTISPTDDDIYIFYNSGGGSFSLPMTIDEEVDDVRFVLPVDLNEDGYPDLFSGSYYNGSMYFYENLSYQGCTDPSACNFQENATADDGSCCYGECGCTDFSALNFDILATCDDGSCEIVNCTDPEACNFNPNAFFDDGSCEYGPCILLGDANGDGEVNVLDLLDVSNNFGCVEDCAEGDANGDGVVNVMDFIIISLYWGATN